VGNTKFDLWLEISEIVGAVLKGEIKQIRIGQPYLDYR
jgi:hypothetical protein